MPAIKKTICVCGAGTMGAGIALMAAQKDFLVKLYDLDPEMLPKATRQIHSTLQILVEKQKLSTPESERIAANIQYVYRIEDCKADLIIEAIIERLPEKIELFRQLAVINGADAVYTSNTSSLSVSAIASALPYPEKVVGMHFFNPATVMPLVELVSTRYTSAELIAYLVEMVKAMGKTPVVCKDAPGFIVNRVARPFYIESLRLAEEGIPIAVIDNLLTASGFKMGPFKLMDLIGNDINYAVSCSVFEQLGAPERLKPSHLQQELISAGSLGRKTGSGFYIYSI